MRYIAKSKTERKEERSERRREEKRKERSAVASIYITRMIGANDRAKYEELSIGELVVAWMRRGSTLATVPTLPFSHSLHHSSNNF